MIFFFFILLTKQENDFIMEYDKETHTVISLNLDATEMFFEANYQGDEIQIIGENAAYNSTNKPVLHSKCKTLDLSKTKIITIKTNAFYHAQIQTLLLPDSLKTIEYDAFRDINITELKIPSSLESFIGAFNSCSSLVEFTKNESNMNFVIQNNIIYSSDRSSIIRASARTQYEDIKYINDVVRIESYSFSATNITQFEGSSKISYIGFGAFESCFYLKDLNLVQTSITEINPFCFKNSIITFLILPPNIQIIKYNAFEHCRIVSLFLPSSITDIEEKAFSKQEGDLRVFYFGKYSFENRSIFSVQGNGSIQIFVPTSYKYTTLAGINVTFCSMDEMFVPPTILRCTIQPCKCHSLGVFVISLAFH